ncbi:hypothetical protein GQ457_06G010370 [Hibiscus cannabinus]
MILYCWVMFCSYNVELLFAASFDSKMGILCSVFDVKKHGKPIREVRTRYWKLREGENRLSVLLEDISDCVGWFLVSLVHVAARFSAYLVSSIGTLQWYRYPKSTLESAYRYC